VVAPWLADGLSPPVAWWRLVGTPRQFATLVADGRLNAILVGLLVYAAAAGVLLAWAYWGFNREDRRERP
jgi:hypothetical protein